MAEDEDSKPIPMTPETRRDASLRRIAQSVTDIAEGLRLSEQRQGKKDEQLVGLVLSLLPDAKKKADRKRRDSDDYSDSFQLPGGASLDLPRRTQHVIIRLILKYAWIAILFIATHVAHYLYAHQAIIEAQQKQPTPIAVPIRSPELSVPALQPPTGIPQHP